MVKGPVILGNYYTQEIQKSKPSLVLTLELIVELWVGGWICDGGRWDFPVVKGRRKESTRESEPKTTDLSQGTPLFTLNLCQFFGVLPLMRVLILINIYP